MAWLGVISREKEKQGGIVAGLIESVYVVKIGCNNKERRQTWVREGVIIGVKEGKVFLKRIAHLAWAWGEYKVRAS